MDSKVLPKLFSSATNTQVAVAQTNFNLNTGETYVHYGKKLCGLVSANTLALGAFLTKVYQTERQRQIDDKVRQDEIKKKYQDELARKKDEITNRQAQLTNIYKNEANLRMRIDELNASLIEAKANDGKENKMAKVKLIIGLVILAILTFYLFIFYSSTFYSAFLMTADQLIDNDTNVLGIAMFNTHAIPDAYHDGLGAMSFILSAPIIFLGLGYCLHFFVDQSTWKGVVKGVAMLAVTLAFDCILAYKIGELLYSLLVISSWTEMEPYSIALALKDVNTWAVIFCGFIVYLIWGIVFDMVMTAYSELRSNKKEIKKIQAEINSKKEELNSETAKIAPLEAEIASLQNRVDDLNSIISGNVFIDKHIMEVALTDFFAGWTSIMTSLTSDMTNHQKAKEAYDNAINSYIR